MGQYLVIAFVALICNRGVQAYIACGNNTCEGVTAYCCDWDDDECCWGSWVGIWWLWCLACIFLLLIATCVVSCCRQPLRDEMYLIIPNTGQPLLYGATSSYAVHGGLLASAQRQGQKGRYPV